jgi:hypothetical protein
MPLLEDESVISLSGSGKQWGIMQDKSITPSENPILVSIPRLPSRTEHLVTQIEHLLQQSEPSFEHLAQKVAALPEAYRQQVVEVLAERMAHTMQLHFLLDIVPTFSQQATAEEILLS